MSQNPLRVAEMFTSLQGEGPNACIPMFFIRLAQCNLKCPWCDADLVIHKGEEISIEDILYRYEKSGLDWICVTGGEPLLQAKNLKPLILKPRFVEIETNGTIEVPNWIDEIETVVVDYKLPSSKSTIDFNPDWFEKATTIKFVINDLEDLQAAKAVLKETKGLRIISSFSTVWTCKPEIRKTVIEECIRSGIRYNMQTHKYLGLE